MPRRKPWIFDATECLGHLSVMLSIVKAFEAKHGLPPGLVRCRKSAERFVAEAEEHLSNWTGT